MFPSVFVCHGAEPWQEAPPRHPGIRRWIAVDLPSRARLLDSGIPVDRIVLLFNFVDLARFPSRPPLPERPRRALVFSNNMSSGGFKTIRAACRQESIGVEAGGVASGHAIDEPEKVLTEFDLVFAKARCALEAMATGCAVILCDQNGLGPMVGIADVGHLRDLNFGFRTLVDPISRTMVRLRL